MQCRVQGVQLSIGTDICSAAASDLPEPETARRSRSAAVDQSVRSVRDQSPAVRARSDP